MYKKSIIDAFEPKGKIKKKSVLIIGVTGFLFILAVWSALSYSGAVSAMFLPTPTKTVGAAIEMLANENYLSDILITVIRVMSGFVISAVVAIPLGILIGTYAPITAFFDPIFSFVRYLPASAFIPLFILWIGIDEKEKIAIIILGSLPQLVLMVATTIKDVKMPLIEASYTLGTNRSNILWKIIMPKALPSIMDTLRIVLGWAWTYVIVAEMVGASTGIGYVIIQSQRMLAVSKIFVGIFTIGIIGLLFDLMFKGLYKLLFQWN